LSFGSILALELFRRHPTIPRSLVLAGGYAGWAGSLSPAAVEERLEACLRASTLPPEEFVAAMVPSMFSAQAPEDRVTAFAANVADFDPAGFRTMARASAGSDLRDVLGRIDVPTLLLYGDRDVRASMHVARALHDAIPGSALVVLPGVGHVSPVEAPDRFADAVRTFLDSAR
jgi:pimeloyl-ACP methyl ester carboxylesterase